MCTGTNLISVLLKMFLSSSKCFNLHLSVLLKTFLSCLQKFYNLHVSALHVSMLGRHRASITCNFCRRAFPCGSMLKPAFSIDDHRSSGESSQLSGHTVWCFTLHSPTTLSLPPNALLIYK